MKKFLAEFKEFAMRGNVMDLAIGVIIGAAFQAIVKSLTDDIISPILGLFLRTDFSQLSVTVLDVEIRYGSFLTAIINFIIMAFIIFLLVKVMNTLANVTTKKKARVEAATTKKCPYCCSEISIEAVRCPNCTSEL